MKRSFENMMATVAGTYGQVFFSDNKVFALFLLMASFADPATGLSGLICALFTVLLSAALGLNRTFIHNGTYSFNSLLTGLALGANFALTPHFFILLLLASALTLLITVSLMAFNGRYALPFLSLPFIITVWIVFLNARSFEPGFFAGEGFKQHLRLFI